MKSNNVFTETGVWLHENSEDDQLPSQRILKHTFSIQRLDFSGILALKCHSVHTPCSIFNKYIKHFQKMYRDVGMAMPKTTETRCRDGSVQARHVIQRLHN